MFDVSKLDFDAVTDDIVLFIQRIVADAKAQGVVVGLSGGVDSAVVAALCARGLSKDRVLGILMPTNFTPAEGVDDAENLAKKLGVRTELVNIQPIADSLFKSLHISEKDSEQKIPKANIYARIRMIILYFNANVNNYLVAGTGDRSESLIGYFTKYGDGGVDFSPIVHLYKTEVRQLARHLGIPKKIADKPSSPQLYPGQKATDQIPLDYKDLDPLIAGLFDSKSSVKEVGSLADFPSEKVAEVLRLFDLSKHKRTMPPMIVDPRIIREK